MQITFVGILGGGEGARFERGDLKVSSVSGTTHRRELNISCPLPFQELKDMLLKRKRIEEIMAVAIKELACCMSFGILKCGMCQGWTSGIFYLEILINRIAFCSPTKTLPLSLKLVDPLDFEAYLTHQSKTLVNRTERAPASSKMLEPPVLISMPDRVTSAWPAS